MSGTNTVSAKHYVRAVAGVVELVVESNNGVTNVICIPANKIDDLISELQAARDAAALLRSAR